jgi:hypothetical protein
VVPGSAGVVRDIRANMERTSLPKGLDHYGPDDERNSRQPCRSPAEPPSRSVIPAGVDLIWHGHQAPRVRRDLLAG